MPKRPRTSPRRRSLFADVLKRNPGNATATEGLARVKRAMADNEFNAAMGAGLAALNAGRLSEATHRTRTRARHAARQPPKSARRCTRWPTPAPGRSLAELEQRAARLASEERWTEALAIYEEALARDPSLQFAQQGPGRRGAAGGTRQAPAGTHRQAGTTGGGRVSAPKQSGCWRARGHLPNQGPVIRSQVSRLELLLPTFNQPVMLALESDNATEVAIQRVGFFGAFEKRQVELKPGKYTVTGKRSGFRDVRREITVAPGQGEQTIVIRCLEPI